MVEHCLKPPLLLTCLMLELGGLCLTIFAIFQNRKSNIRAHFGSDWPGEWRWDKKKQDLNFSLKITTSVLFYKWMQRSECQLQPLLSSGVVTHHSSRSSRTSFSSISCFTIKNSANLLPHYCVWFNQVWLTAAKQPNNFNVASPSLLKPISKIKKCNQTQTGWQSKCVN